MAINKMLHINECENRSPGEHLKNAIEYISNPLKTQNGKNIITLNCSKNSIFDEMMNLKKKYGKDFLGNKHNRMAYHFIISFSPKDNVSTELSEKISKEFCEQYLKNRYQVCIATHNDKMHMHSHIIFNSVAMDNGLKYHYEKGNWKKEILPLLNNICKKYNLSTIELGGLEDEDLSFFKTNNKPHVLTIEKTIKNEIDILISKAFSFENLLYLLREKGYKVNIRGQKTITIIPPGFSRGRVLSSLGSGYSKEDLIERIKNKNISSKETVFEKKEKVVSYNVGIITGLKRKWCLNNLRIIKIGNLEYSVAAKYVEDFKRLQKAQEEYFFLRKNNIKNKDDFYKFIDDKKQKLKQNNLSIKKMSVKVEQTKELTRIKDRIEELSKCVEAHNLGNSFFDEEFDEYVRLNKLLDKENLSVEKINELEKETKETYLNLKNKSRDIKREIHVAERCLEKVETEKREDSNNQSGHKKIYKKEKEKYKEM